MRPTRAPSSGPTEPPPEETTSAHYLAEEGRPWPIRASSHSRRAYSLTIQCAKGTSLMRGNPVSNVTPAIYHTSHLLTRSSYPATGLWH
ncbi:hypothetical protein N7449_005866 [Penicillium cf. viridicatum]|uniref:Uncharacterized protein n=1 Tax=Penicillium cf. viridicatum TaxID=2972119 RepID=A0A9W9SWA6_9EURO|nr:hypothetical protein N7449_005866 [Penicillium cf. viridicatum]